MDVDEIVDPHDKPDFRRANGAPMIIDHEGKNQRFSRPSGWGKELDDENALVNWKINRAIEGVAGDPALQARAVAAKPDDRSTWSALREAAINAGRGDQGADIGTAIHAMSERWEDPDDDFHPGEPFEAHLEAYSVEMERLGLISHLAECPMVNTEWRAAGTCDRLYVLDRPLVTPEGEILPVGTMVVGDLKTGKKLDFSAPGYSVQMAIYAGGQLYDVARDEFLSTPEINQRWGILVHLPSDRPECEMLWVDLEIGRWGAYLTQQTREWRKNWRKGEFALGPITVVEGMSVEDAVEALEGELLDMEQADAEWLQANAAWCKSRLDQIAQHEEARKRLKILWPGELNPKNFRAGDVSTEQMLSGMKLLDRIEAEFGLTFVEGQPSTGTHNRDVKNVPPSTTTSKENES